ncbi:MAG: site-2 protease family protein [Thermoplasmatota archaeon]
MAASITIARIAGIPIRLHVSFLLALPIFAYLMAAAYFAPSGVWPTEMGWIWGSLLALGLFASVLLHELAHSTLAMRRGVSVRDITLLPIGGISAFNTIPREPGAEFWITFVGPLTNLVLSVPLLLLWWLGYVPASPAGFPTFVEWLGFTNLSLGVFNMFLPAFPMDGGRILRAILARRMGLTRATHVAAGIGRGVALILGIGGLFIGDILLVLIAVFVFAGAGAEEHATVLSESLTPYNAGELATPVETLPPDITVSAAIERLRANRRFALPVVSQGHIMGLARLDLLARIPKEARMGRLLGSALAVAPAVTASTPAPSVAETISSSRSPAIVVDERGALVGILSAQDLEQVSTIEQLAGRRGGPAAGPPPAQPGFG